MAPLLALAPDLGETILARTGQLKPGQLRAAMVIEMVTKVITSQQGQPARQLDAGATMAMALKIMAPMG
jgi:hypothetical protein